MSDQLRFKVFCLEAYRFAHAISGSEAHDRFKQANVFEYLADYYDVLHSTGQNYLVSDIDSFLAARS